MDDYQGQTGQGSRRYLKNISDKNPSDRGPPRSQSATELVDSAIDSIETWQHRNLPDGYAADKCDDAGYGFAKSERSLIHRLCDKSIADMLALGMRRPPADVAIDEIVRKLIFPPADLAAADRELIGNSLPKPIFLWVMEALTINVKSFERRIPVLGKLGASVARSNGSGELDRSTQLAELKWRFDEARWDVAQRWYMRLTGLEASPWQLGDKSFFGYAIKEICSVSPSEFRGRQKMFFGSTGGKDFKEAYQIKDKNVAYPFCEKCNLTMQQGVCKGCNRTFTATGWLRLYRRAMWSDLVSDFIDCVRLNIDTNTNGRRERMFRVKCPAECQNNLCCVMVEANSIPQHCPCPINAPTSGHPCHDGILVLGSRQIRFVDINDIHEQYGEWDEYFREEGHD